ncbi:hypothetical protein BDR07DRAFT_1375752 [Suillus spraguei]|nr:hypothetical protein BDR07DRAFT_1375752 [Suillus spraguei]
MKFIGDSITHYVQLRMKTNETLILNNLGILETLSLMRMRGDAGSSYDYKSKHSQFTETLAAEVASTIMIYMEKLEFHIACRIPSRYPVKRPDREWWYYVYDSHGNSNIIESRLQNSESRLGSYPSQRVYSVPAPVTHGFTELYFFRIVPLKGPNITILSCSSRLPSPRHTGNPQWSHVDVITKIMPPTLICKQTTKLAKELKRHQSVDLALVSMELVAKI